MSWKEFCIYALNCIIIIITLFLIYIYIKKRSKVYPIYNILIISFIIFLDNIFRILPLGSINGLRYIQAFILTFLDKFLLTIITCQVVIIYFGVCNTELYFNNKAKIFFFPLIIGMIISFLLTLFDIILNKGITDYDTGKYQYARDGPFKRISDTIFNSILLLINIVCCLRLLQLISKKRKQSSLGLIEDLVYKYHHLKIVIMFIVNLIFFVESFLIIHDTLTLNSEIIDLIYIFTCLLVLLFYTINKIIIKESLKILCPKYYEKLYPSNKQDKNKNYYEDTDNDDNGDDTITPQRTGTF